MQVTPAADSTAHTALVVSIVSLFLSTVVATAAVIAQVLLWRRTGARIRCEQGFAYPTYPGGRLGRAHIVVTAINDGRSSGQISSWGFALPDGSMIVPTAGEMPNPIVPITLEGGHAESWYTPTDDLRSAIEPRGEPVTAFVLLPKGRVQAPHAVKFKER